MQTYYHLDMLILRYGVLHFYSSINNAGLDSMSSFSEKVEKTEYFFLFKDTSCAIGKKTANSATSRHSDL